MTRLALVTLCTLLAILPAYAQEYTLQWILEDVFKMPESAALDADNTFIYVSNVNEYAKDGNGFISRVAVADSSVELRWLDGLDSPTGLAVSEGLLYFADFDSLVVADIASARVLQRYPAPDPNPSLNDVAIAENGSVFVSGSASNSIYLLDGEQLRVWLYDSERLAAANGLYIDGEHLVHGGRHWSVFDRYSGETISPFAAFATELADIDGIARTSCGNFLVSLLTDERLWMLAPDGTTTRLAGSPLNGIDLHAKDGLLAVPQVGGGLTLLRQVPDSCPP